MKYVKILILIFLIQTIYAECSDNQIDINSASLTELDELTGIGPAKAQGIIDSRPYESLDDLINAYGIGEATLEKIKNQGLACVEEKEEPKKEEPQIEETKIAQPTEQIKEEKEIIQETISLTKNIKIDDSENKVTGNKNYMIYALCIFCLVLGFLFTIQKIKKDKNEFN